MPQCILSMARRRQIKTTGSLRLISIFHPLKPASISAARINDEREIQGVVKEILTNEKVHARQKNAPIGMRVIPTHHLQVRGQTLSLAGDLLPGFMGKLKAAFRRLVVLRSEAVAHHHKGLPLFVLQLSAQQHPSQFNRGITLRMRLHVLHYVEIDVDPQFIGLGFLALNHSELMTLVGRRLPFRTRFLNFAKLYFRAHVELLCRRNTRQRF